jgi:hypothetical protein
MPTYFAYSRVSTHRQEILGFGLTAWQAAVGSFLEGDQPRGEHVEIRSGKKRELGVLARQQNAR